MQRRIDALLDEADEAIAASDWARVLDRANNVLALEPGNPDAESLVSAAQRALGATQAPARPSSVAPPPIPVPALPASFAAGRYGVERFLGDGAKKRVFLARDTSLDRLVAFAQLRVEGMDSLGRQRLIREAQAMARLGNHPRLVAIYDIGEEGGTPFIVEEYMPGGDLAAQLRDAGGAGLPLKQVRAIGEAICEALAFIHERQLLHRDLKPSNVFLSEDGGAKVGDFGLAVSLDRSRLTTESSLIGTPSYMPPEQALGGDVTPQSDLYSLGAMLYELVTGRPPFMGDDPTSVISQHINTRPVAPSWYSEHCPPELESVILKCLEKVPADRPASATEVREALSRVDPEGRSTSHSGSSANPLDRLAQGVFVGRTRELERLRTALDNAFSGHGNLVMLVGEPGIGKTRTSKEVETYARMRGAQVLVGKTHESAGMPAYWPWVEVGRAWSEQNNGDLTLLQPALGSAGPELTRIFPELRQLAPNIGEPEPITDPESAQFRLFDAYTTFIRAMAAHKPQLIVLDDLHWADRPTLMLLQHMARTLARMRVLVVGTYRDTDVVRASALSETLVNLNREPGFERIVLRGLERQEVEAYIRATANVNVSPALVQRIHEETEGIPFFLSEVVNLMAEEGTLSAYSSMDVALPDGVKEALGRRLDRLSPEANELLQVASVAGREFRHDTLLALGDRSEDEVFALLEEGLDARVIEEAGQAGRYRFTHALMQETLLDELSTTRKVRLHGRIGDALESRWGGRADERATRLAEHFAEAATLSDRYAERALKYSKLAAEQAETQAAWAEAARRYESCLTLLAETESGLDGDEAGLYLAAGRCHANAAQHRDAWRRLMRATDLYRARGDGSGVGRAALQANGVFAPEERQVALMEAALPLLGDGDELLEAELRGSLAVRLSSVERGREHLERANELAERHDLPQVRAMVLHASGKRASAASQDWSLALRNLRSAREEFSRLGRVRDALEADWQSIPFMFGTGKLTGAIETAIEMRDRARSQHLPFYEQEATAFALGGLLAAGQFERMDDLLDAAGDAPSLSIAGARSALAAVRGDVAGAVRFAPAPDAAGGNLRAKAMVHAYRARAALAAGDLKATALEYAASRESWMAIPSEQSRDEREFMGPPASILNDVMLAQAPPDELRRLLAFRTRVPPWPVDPQGGSPLLAAGRAALVLGDVAQARARAEQALAWAPSEGARLIEAQGHQVLADVLAAEGDEGAALRELDVAANAFKQMGARLYLDQVISRKLALQGITSEDMSSSIVGLNRTLQTEHPDLSSDAAPDGTVTLMFSDIENSTGLNEEFGDAKWMELLRAHNAVLDAAIAAHGGRTVKTMGDGYMVAFKSADDGLRCAIAIQEAMSGRDDGVRVRIGLHTGEMVRDGDDFFGREVNYAARVAGHASGGQAVVSEAVRAALKDAGEFTFEPPAMVQFKGFTGKHRVYALAGA
jgi:class 3 adenylate cyclase